MKDWRIKLDFTCTVALALTAVISIFTIHVNGAKSEEPTQEAATAPVSVEAFESVTVHTETEQPTEPSEPLVKLYDIPLSEEVQLHIINEAEHHGIDPTIIFGMCFRESSYNASAIGDGGNSYGLMQIQARWHSERMERLGCPNLLDPFQNVTVGTDFLAELIDYYNGNIEMALVAYNMGQTGAYQYCFSKGVYSSEYSSAVMAAAKELRGEIIEHS